MFIKLISKFRFIINPLLKTKLFNNKKTMNFIKKYFDRLVNKNNKNNIELEIYEINDLVTPLLRKYKGFIGCGNLLCIVRNQENFIGQDIDYCLQNMNRAKIIKFINEMISLGFRLSSKLFLENKLIEIKFLYKKMNIDFFILEDKKNYNYEYAIFLKDKLPLIRVNKQKQVELYNMCCIQKKWPKITKFINKKFNNHIFIIPKNFDEYLSYHYGIDWKIKNPQFDHFTMPETNKPVILENQGKVIYY